MNKLLMLIGLARGGGCLEMSETVMRVEEFERDRHRGAGCGKTREFDTEGLVPDRRGWRVQ